VYVCTDYDTLNSIADKFKVSVEILKNYNSVDTITSGMKVIIPASNDEN
ncbi:MAG: LysM peptidoglycan-binding domain-containing protein, partial [Bacilli bacterium]|nr:LysM peptidoglycan-binding domain-containing protein [Bacilli bacterium]